MPFSGVYVYFVLLCVCWGNVGYVKPGTSMLFFYVCLFVQTWDVKLFLFSDVQAWYVKMYYVGNMG
jgi:hypothetical protein